MAALPDRQASPETPSPSRAAPRRIGVIVHPSRAVEEPLQELRRWADRRDVALVQVEAPCAQQEVVDRGSAGDCDLIVSIGGDGTTLAALRTAAAVNLPAFGVAFGGLGALTTVVPDAVARSLDRFSRGDWRPRRLPALELGRDGQEPMFALNDVAIVRAGGGQVRITAKVDDVLFSRFAGDGCVISTPAGTSAYAMSAGGPLMLPETDAFALTPLSAHGGFCPPLVMAADSRLELETRVGHGGGRLELDGQASGDPPRALSVTLRPAAATVVTFADDEPLLAGLRRRHLLLDSPQMLAADELG